MQYNKYVAYVRLSSMIEANGVIVRRLDAKCRNATLVVAAQVWLGEWVVGGIRID